MTVHLTPTSRIPPLFVSLKAVDHVVVETVDGFPAEGTFDVLVIATRLQSGETFQPFALVD